MTMSESWAMYQRGIEETQASGADLAETERELDQAAAMVAEAAPQLGELAGTLSELASQGGEYSKLNREALNDFASGADRLRTIKDELHEDRRGLEIAALSGKDIGAKTAGAEMAIDATKPKLAAATTHAESATEAYHQVTRDYSGQNEDVVTLVPVAAAHSSDLDTLFKSGLPSVHAQAERLDNSLVSLGSDIDDAIQATDEIIDQHVESILAMADKLDGMVETLGHLLLRRTAIIEGLKAVTSVQKSDTENLAGRTKNLATAVGVLVRFNNELRQQAETAQRRVE